MDSSGIERAYFIGIGGIGMSSLARYFLQQGLAVGGYDRTPSALTAELQELGMLIHFEEDPQAIPDSFLKREGTLVVFTPAVPPTHRELKYFRDSGFRVMKRAEVLGEVTRDSICLAVAGTHGKTTTSAILAHLMKEAGKPVMAFLGGIAENFGSNFLYEGTQYAVVEADEFDRSFLRLHPDIACVTSMDADHLDIYGDGEQLERTFAEFTSRVGPGGKVFVREGLPLQGLTYGEEAAADYRILDPKVVAGGYRFDLQTPKGLLRDLQFNQPGRHNLLNGTVALAMAMEAGVEAESLRAALATFSGVSRRFTYKLRTEDLIFIDDYAHHPTEIDAVAAAVREMHPDKRVLAIFQPHLFSRTRDFAEAFARSLSAFDELLLLPIYPAREAPLPGITSEWLLEQVSGTKSMVSKEDLIDEIKKRQPELILTIGAGDIGVEANRIKNEFHHE